MADGIDTAEPGLLPPRIPGAGPIRETAPQYRLCGRLMKRSSTTRVVPIVSSTVRAPAVFPPAEARTLQFFPETDRNPRRRRFAHRKTSRSLSALRCHLIASAIDPLGQVPQAIRSN